MFRAARRRCPVGAVPQRRGCWFGASLSGWQRRLLTGRSQRPSGAGTAGTWDAAQPRRRELGKNRWLRSAAERNRRDRRDGLVARRFDPLYAEQERAAWKPGEKLVRGTASSDRARGDRTQRA